MNSQKTFFIWKNQANQDAQSMEGSGTKAKYSGTAFNPEELGIYETGNRNF